MNKQKFVFCVNSAEKWPWLNLLQTPDPIGTVAFKCSLSIRANFSGVGKLLREDCCLLWNRTNRKCTGRLCQHHIGVTNTCCNYDYALVQDRTKYSPPPPLWGSMSFAKHCKIPLANTPCLIFILSYSKNFSMFFFQRHGAPNNSWEVTLYLGHI